MKIISINPAYVPETILRDYINPHYVKFRESEIGLLKIPTTKFGKIVDRICESDAIVAKDPLFHDRWVCVALDGRLAWSASYKTIRAAIRNACYA